MIKLDIDADGAFTSQEARPYVRWCPESSTALLEGHFTAADLFSIANRMRDRSRMTVGQLMDALRSLDKDSPVFVQTEIGGAHVQPLKLVRDARRGVAGTTVVTLEGRA